MTQPYTGLGNKPSKMSSFHLIRDLYLLIIGTLCVLAIIGCWNQLVQMNEKDKFVDVSENNVLNRPPPPPKSDAARYARYIVHYSDWCAVAHTSRQPGTNGYPMSRIYSMVDGTLTNSSGTPYLYISAMDEGVQDLMLNDSRCSVTISLAEGSFCHVEEFDPEDPRCPQVTLTGRFQVVKNSTEEYQWAKNSMFSRHPQMMSWPKGHHFFLAKVNVENILLVNNIGGNKYPSVTDYFKADPVPRDTVYDQVVKKYL